MLTTTRVILIHCQQINPLSPHDALKHHFTSLKNRLNFPTTKAFRMNISMKLVYQCMVIFLIFKKHSNHFHSLLVVNCDSNSRLVVDEDDYGKLRLERVNQCYWEENVLFQHLYFPLCGLK